MADPYGGAAYGGFSQVGPNVYGAPAAAPSGAAGMRAGQVPQSAGWFNVVPGQSSPLPAGATPNRPKGEYEQSGFSDTGNFFWDPHNQFSANQGVGALIPAYFAAGAFDPTGGGGYLDAIKRMLGSQEQGDIARAGLTADIYGGGDPLARVYGRIQAQQAAANRYPGIIAQAQAAAAQAREQEIFNLLNQRLGAVTYAQRPRTDYGAIAGQIGGAGLGALLGG
jgi:hypothetical protein